MRQAAARRPESSPRSREQRKAETRARLLAAARTLFVERGFDATRPQDVARAAGVAAGTFYVHFADKREAFLAVTDEAAAALMERIRRVTEGRPSFDAGLRAALEALVAFADDHPGLLSACFADAGVIAAGLPQSASLRERLTRQLAEGLRRGHAAGELRGDFDPDVIAAGVVGLAQHALLHGRGRDRRSVIDDVTRFCARALVREPLPEVPA